MNTDPFDFTLPFLTTPRQHVISIRIISDIEFDQWISRQSETIKLRAAQNGFVSASEKALLDHENSVLFFAGCNVPTVFDFAKIYDDAVRRFDRAYLKDVSFALDSEGLSQEEIEAFHLGWGMGAYHFKLSDKAEAGKAFLVWHKSVDQKRVQAQLNSIYLLRNLINIPTIDMGPVHLQEAVEHVGATHKASVKVINGKKLESGFPLVHAVGMASHRAPRLIELNWGKAKNPRICIVGKGVCFDTGGLDIKPSQYMRYMKKDMGGAAHALALANMIMALKLPIRLQLLIPAVENAVAAESFRPGDVFKSRKGLTVENTNTDAEGRLILADSLTYGCESQPDLMIDFATLTGSARAALGQDIPAMFSNDDEIAKDLQKMSFAVHDPLWTMPLWAPYHKLIESTVADLHNSAGVPGDLIYSALFLKSFVSDDTKWIHIDTFAWESEGRPGRAKGAMDLGVRSLFSYLEGRYA